MPLKRKLQTRMTTDHVQESQSFSETRFSAWRDMTCDRLLQPIVIVTHHNGNNGELTNVLAEYFIKLLSSDLKIGLKSDFKMGKWGKGGCGFALF